VPDRVDAGSSPSLPVPTIVAICDVVLGEVGRREHMFSWLRAPGSEPGQWLAVDAYYPANRLVVVCDPEGFRHEQLYAELIPAHGLRLLALEADELPDDPALAAASLRERIGALGAPPPAAHQPAPRDRPARDRPGRDRPGREQPGRPHPVAAAVASLVQPVAAPAVAPRPVTGSRAAAAERAARLLAARRTGVDRARRSPSPGLRAAAVRRSQPRSPRERAGAAQAGIVPPPSVLIGLALAAALGLETYAAVGIAVGSGQMLLSLGIVLDGCARVLGAIAAVKLGRQDWAWGCVIFGSPAVATISLFQRSGPVTTELAPLAGVVSLLALGLVAVGLLAHVAGL
jgi:hypothetical protein